MGYFTWTDARREPKLLKTGDYSKRDKIPYGGFAKIVCPDDTEIEESCYEGYGEFGPYNIYELVVDWNKEHLKEIFEKLAQKNPKHWGCDLKPLAEAYQSDDMEAVDTEIYNILSLGSQTPVYSPDFNTKWKQAIGIAIVCDNNEDLPFPIKITNIKWHITYDSLVPSHSCQ